MNLSITITPNGSAPVVYTMAGGTDLGDWKGTPGKVQKQILATIPAGGLPDTYIYFRPDADGSRVEVVIERGTYDASIAQNTIGKNISVANNNGYTAQVFDGTTALSPVINVPNHWWGSRWRWQSVPRPVIFQPADLMAARILPAYGNTGTPLTSIDLTRAVYTNPMDGAGVCPTMGQTGERWDIGFIPEPVARYLNNPSDANALRATLAWAEASGTVPWNMRDRKTNTTIDLVANPKSNFYPDGARLQGTPNFPDPSNALLAPAKDANGNVILGSDGKPWMVGESGWFTDDAHFPALSYVAFALTRDLYFLEGTQFESTQAYMATAYYSQDRYGYPPTGRAVVDFAQVRAAAWGWRSLIMARKSAELAEQVAGTVPSSIKGSAHWKKLSDLSLDYYTTHWVQSAHPLATIFSQGPRFGDGEPWQDDFLCFVWGFAVWSGYEEFRPGFEFKLKSVLARTNGKTGWPRAFCSPYYLNLCTPEVDVHFDTDAPLKTATWPTNWADAWTQFATRDIAAYDAKGLSGQITQKVYDALKADPENGGKFAQIGGGAAYLYYTRAALIMAVSNGYTDAAEPLTFVNKMVTGIGGIDAKWSILATTGAAPVTLPPPVVVPPPVTTPTGPTTPTQPSNPTGGNMSFIIATGQTKRATLTLTDAKGVAHALPDGVVPVWTVSPANTLTVTPDANGLGASIIGGETDGAVTLTATTTYANGDKVVVNIAGQVANEDTQGVISIS